MKKIPELISKHKKTIIFITLLLMIPAIIGYKKTRINYDILVYLPSDIETMKGQDILTNDFNMGAFSVTIVENMNAKDLLKLENKIKDIDGVANVASYADLTGTTIPKEMLPNDIVNKISKDNSDLLLITFKDSTSSETTMKSVEKIREITNDTTKVGGMSSMVLDTKNLSEQEIVIYIAIAVSLCIIVLMLSLDSYLVPFILLANIGIAILFNMGTNVFLGNISYITKAISAVLQLGVTTDFSIFLYRRYQKAKKECKNKEAAMSLAIKDTFTSVLGSSLTTIAGFLALCTMTLTLGRDIGIVMAKGVVFGVICVLIVFPALLLAFDKQIENTRHKEIFPEFTKFKKFTVNKYKAIFVVFLILFIPAYFGNKHTEVYYNLDDSLPKDLASSIANTELKDKFNIVSPEIILVDKNLKNDQVNEMVDKISDMDGIDFVISFSKLKGAGFDESVLSDSTRKILESDKYQAIIVNSTYKTATDELNAQVKDISKLIKEYDKNGILAGEGPLTTDLVNISNQDFINVNYTSIAVIFIIMLLVLKSISLPFILVATIEFAIFINMGIPYYMGTKIPFIASIVIGTIQLGATIDYAILMTTKYMDERKNGVDKFKAIKTALDHSVSSIIVSALCFFAATFGVGVYSKLEMISSLCTLMSRGAIISMIVVITVLPSLLIIFDKLIMKTSWGFKKEEN
jgi:predicted RND superfamily exporter protein